METKFHEKCDFEVYDAIAKSEKLDIVMKVSLVPSWVLLYICIVFMFIEHLLHIPSDGHWLHTALFLLIFIYTFYSSELVVCKNHLFLLYKWIIYEVKG